MLQPPRAHHPRWQWHRVTRLLVTWVLCAVSVNRLYAGSAPEELRSALKAFQAEGTRGWAFTQTTQGEGQTLVERFDPRLPEFRRWTLLQKNGRVPSADETRVYNESQTRRSRGETAPNVKDQIDEATAEKVGDEGPRTRWRFRLRTTDKSDRSAAHMTATFTLHRPTGTIEQVVLASFEPFNPVLGVQVKEAMTTIDYTLPEGEYPTFLKRITVRLRGRAWWFKSLDQDLEVHYSDFERVRRS